MRKIVLPFSVFILLLLFSCTPVNQEELNAQAANQLQNLSDAELQQLAEQNVEGKAIAGQVYRAPNLRVAGTQTVLRRMNSADRSALITAEQARRQPRRQDEPCSTDNECMSSLRCRYDSVTRRNTCQWWNVGEACTLDSDCATNICGISETGSRNCEEGNNLVNYRCRSDRECQSGLICGVNSVSIAESYPPQCGGGYVCEVPNSGIRAGRDYCEQGRECASGRCNLQTEFCGSYGYCA